MQYKVPIVRQVAWLSMIPQFLLLTALFFLIRFIGFNNHVCVGMILYFTLFYFLRFIIPKHHRRGVALYKKKLFSEAIPHFQKSYDFFKNNMWLDRYRFITLMSSSGISYTEMALVNMAFCYAQAGDGEKSKEVYETALKEFPNSEIAKMSLKILETGKNITESG